MRNQATSRELGAQEQVLYNQGSGHTQTIDTLCFASASKSSIFDTDGKKYIDLNGTLNLPLGHDFTELREAAAKNLPLNAVSYATLPRIDLCQKLRELFPGYSAFQFYSAGTEANEGAIRYAIAITGKDGFGAFRKSFHGRTRATVSLCNMKAYNGARLPGYFRVDYPRDEAQANNILGELEKIITLEHSRTTAGIFVEPIQGKTVCIPPKGFLRELEALCKRLDILLIADEYLTSFRTGVNSVCLSQGVEPDLFIVGKCLGNGVPFSALLCKDEYAEKVSSVKGSTTFGGNPLSCESVLRVIKRLERERLIERCSEQLEPCFREETAALNEQPNTRACYAKGALMGIELVDKATCIRISRAVLERGVLVSCIGSVIRITPAFNIEIEELRHALRIISEEIRYDAQR